MHEDGAGRGEPDAGTGRHTAAPGGDGPGGDGPGGGGPGGGELPEVVLARGARRAALARLADELAVRAPVVDGYAVGELIGAGATSAVWSGTGPDGVPRALKVLQPASAAGAEPLRELALLRRVRHPRLVAVHDISRDGEGHPVLVLDLAAGGGLAGVLAARRRLGVGEVAGLVSVLGPALDDLHAAGVVHGDLSPGNVLLDARGEPLLADLGVARALGHRPGRLLGTPGYADPSAAEAPGAAADVYGLAAVAWCALTGAPPPEAGASRAAVRRAGADLPPGTSQELLEALREGLHRRPARRPTAGELAEAVLTCARPRPVRLPQRAPATVPPPPAAGATTGAGLAAAPAEQLLAPTLTPVPAALAAAVTRDLAPPADAQHAAAVPRARADGTVPARPRSPGAPSPAGRAPGRRGAPPRAPRARRPVLVGAGALAALLVGAVATTAAGGGDRDGDPAAPAALAPASGAPAQAAAAVELVGDPAAVPDAPAGPARAPATAPAPPPPPGAGGGGPRAPPPPRARHRGGDRAHAARLLPAAP
ncbi:serine/threonine-protein kinase, partial [Kineococcus terrestris]|uniref:serine/threonine-protein kinase n=1 Tax=Kineococcus terrestris TaxID=2044856 RepID=UPI0034DAE319